MVLAARVKGAANTPNTLNITNYIGVIMPMIIISKLSPHVNHNYLTTDRIRALAPSVFTADSAARTSEKYQHISTSQLVARLEEEGFYPVHVQQSRSRSQDKRYYAKHLLRFRHVNTRPTEDGLFPELVLINSHDGLSSYRLLAGLYRLVCTNGLVAGKTYDEVRVRHQGDILGQVIEGTYQVINEAQRMIESSQAMREIALNPEQQQRFAEAAHALRFGASEVGKGFEAQAFLKARRHAEVNRNDLFSIFNIVQENLLRGQIRGWRRDHHGWPRRTQTRALTSIDQGTQLNQALWSLAEQTLQMH